MVTLLLFIGGAVGWALFGYAAVRAPRWKNEDLVAGLASGLAFEAIALYDNDGEDLVFEFVPNRFAQIIGRARNPDHGEYHWDYWEYFKDTRPDWNAVIQRVLTTGIPVSQEGEVIVYPNGRRVVLDWECGLRYDAGRPWRGRQPVGIYITHRRSAGAPDPALTARQEAMARKNARLESELAAFRSEDYTGETASAAIERLLARIS